LVSWAFEKREWEDEIDGVQPQSLSAAAADAGVMASQKRAVIIFNSLLHGFSWDGAPSLVPAIAVATWSGNLAFLSGYAVGTMVTMAAVTTLIGDWRRNEKGWAGLSAARHSAEAEYGVAGPGDCHWSCLVWLGDRIYVIRFHSNEFELES
jgi:hypothetical protein